MRRLRTRETVLLGLLLALAPAALAQEQEPTLNESHFDSSPPSSDESYLAEDEASTTSSAAGEPDPGLSEGDFDMSGPSADASYLDAETAGDGEAGGASRADTPFPGILAALGVLAIAALALCRRG